MAFEDLLLKYGLVQFGRFADGDGGFMPYKLKLDWMVSYPDVLKAAVDTTIIGFRLNMKHLMEPYERLFCTLDALPLATLVSAEVGLPVVYSRGSGEATVHDLIGAYDINHPTLFLTNTFYDADDLRKTLQGADRVGLKVDTAMALIDCGVRYPIPEIGWGSRFHVKDLAELAFSKGLMEEIQRQWVLDWIDQHPKYNA